MVGKLWENAYRFRLLVVYGYDSIPPLELLFFLIVSCLSASYGIGD